MRRTALVAVSILAGAGLASAQPAMTPSEPIAPVPGELDERVAIGLSLGATLATWGTLAAIASSGTDPDESAVALLAVGTFLAPTAGHWYAGSLVSRGMGIRALAAGALVAGLTMSLPACGLDEDCGSEIGPVLIWGGLALYAAGTIDDLLSVSGKVRRRNEQLRGVMLAPSRTGVALVGRF